MSNFQPCQLEGNTCIIWSYPYIQEFVTGLTLKPLSDTRWEARIDSVKTVRYQCGSICDALEKIALTTENAQAKSEAES